MQDELKKCTNVRFKNIYVSRLNMYTTAFLEEDDYIALSSDWARLRKSTLKRDGYRCQKCGTPYNLHVHHIRYPDAWGTESLDDLITLCDSCHNKIHERGE